MLLPHPCVCQMIPPFAPRDALLCGLDAEVLVDAGQLFFAAVEQDEIAHQLKKAAPCSHILRRYLSSLFSASSASSSFQVRKYLSSVLIAP